MSFLFTLLFGHYTFTNDKKETVIDAMFKLRGTKALLNRSIDHKSEKSFQINMHASQGVSAGRGLTLIYCIHWLTHNLLAVRQEC